MMPFHRKLHIWFGTSQLTNICQTCPLARQSTPASRGVNGTKLYRGTSPTPDNDLCSRIYSKNEAVDLTSPCYNSAPSISGNMAPFHLDISRDGATGAQTCPMRPFPGHLPLTPTQEAAAQKQVTHIVERPVVGSAKKSKSKTEINHRDFPLLKNEQ